MNSHFRILATLSLLALAASPAVAQAPPPNPVFVNDSAEAARLLARARDIADTNPAESIRLVQVVLDDHQFMLVPDTQETGRFESARAVALDILTSNESLQERYAKAEAKQAEAMLEQGRLRRLVETRSHTPAGLEGLLVIAQQNLEAGRLAIASIWLQEALTHPALSDQDRWAAWLMLAMASHGRGDRGAVDDMANRLAQAGPKATPWRDALKDWTSQQAPAVAVGSDVMDTSDSPVGDLLEPALWTAMYERTPATILANNEFADDEIDDRIQSGRLTAIVPAILDHHVFFNEGSDVVRMNLFTGMEDWRTSILDASERSDRIDDPIGPTAVAVDGDDVVTWIGYSMEGRTSESEEIVCLDAMSGEERWRYDLAETPQIDDPQSLYPAGPAVIHEDRVFVIARRERRQGLKSSYLLALNRDDGTPAFVSYIASTGSQYREGSLRPLTMPVVDDDQVIVASSIGAIASVDVASGRVRWLQRLDTPVAGTQAAIRIRPYHIHLPLVVKDKVISLSPDFRHVLVMDRMTGKRETMMLIEDRPEWKSASYMLADGEHVYIVGASLSSLDPDDLSVPLWTTWPRAKGQGMSLAGRVHLAGDRLYIPTGSSVTEVDTSTGDIIRRLPITGSSLPVVTDGHLLLGGAEGLTLHADRSRIVGELDRRLKNQPDDVGTHLAMIRVAARSGNRPLLLERVSMVMPILNDQEPEDQLKTQLIRNGIFEEICSTLDPNEAVSRTDYLAVRNLLDQFTSGTSMEASAKLAIGDWMAGSDLRLAVSHWRELETNPALSDSMHAEDSIVAPASAWARRRLANAAMDYPELVPAPPWIALDDLEVPWERRMAAMAQNMRTQRDTDRLEQNTVRMLEESIETERALEGLALLDLWKNAHESSSGELAGESPDAWRQRLVEKAYPAIPRHEASSGRTFQWPGKLVSQLYKDRAPTYSQHAFLRSHQDRLTWHVAPDYEASWTTYLTHREAAIVHQDDKVVIIQISNLGKPAQLVSMATDDGRVHWEIDLPGEIFESHLSSKQVADEDDFLALTSSGWVAIEPIGNQIVLLHQDGRCSAISADDASRILWQASLPGHVIKDHTPWLHGVAVLGYSHKAAGNDWLDVDSQPGDMILAWLDAETGEIKQTDLPEAIGLPLWLRSNDIGDLIVGGSMGVALYRKPGSSPDWISLSRTLQAMRIRDGARVTPQALIVMDLQYDLHPISLRSGRELESIDNQTRNTLTGMPRLVAAGDRLWMLYEKELQILDAQGSILGTDATSRTQLHRFDAIAPFSDGLILVDQTATHSNRHMSSHVAGPNHPYKLQVLEPGGRSVETLDLFNLDSRIRAARAVDGMMLLSTDEEVLAIQLPPTKEEANP